MKRNVILVLIGVAILLVGGIVYYFYATGKISPKAAVGGATISLNPNIGTYEPGATFKVDINFDTASREADGIDIYSLNYDTQILEVQDDDAVVEGVQIKPNTSFFPVAQGNLVDTTAGKIRISGIVSSGSPGYTGTGTLATITFKALAASTGTDVKFDFTAGSTADTNIMEHGTAVDILESVIDGSYKIGSTPPPPKPTVNIKANNSDGPIEIDSGTAATLSWTATPDGATCTASGGWSGTKALTGTASTGNLTQPKTYTLACVNTTGSATDSVVINIKSIIPLPQVSLKVNGQDEVTIQTGETVTLTWTSTGATTCVASGDWSGNKPASGTTVIDSLNEAKSYTLTCTNTSGSAYDRVLVYVEGQPAPVVITVDLKADNYDDPITIQNNTAATLSWTSTNADSCTASNGWGGDKATSGTESTGNLIESKTYTLTCQKDDASAVDSVTVDVSGQPQASPGPSDGSTIGTEEKPLVSETPTNKTTTSKTTLYKGGVIKPWALWIFYAIIPLSITGGVIYFYIRRKRQNIGQSANDDLNTLPKDWPNTSV